jgi:hypothetical protein
MNTQSTWNRKGYAESAEAHYVQSLTEDELLAFVSNVTGKDYNLANYAGNKKGGLIGSLNRIAINHLQSLTGKEKTAADYVGRKTKPVAADVITLLISGGKND